MVSPTIIQLTGVIPPGGEPEITNTVVSPTITPLTGLTSPTTPPEQFTILDDVIGGDCNFIGNWNLSSSVASHLDSVRLRGRTMPPLDGTLVTTG